MFKILDGRDKFYQWDLDRQLVVEDPTISQVHFCNRTDNCSLVCEVYDEDGLRVVDVPNILLQSDLRINVYGFDSVFTKYSEVFEVIKRTKPADYVYTEVEILNYSKLEEQINEIDEKTDTMASQIDEFYRWQEWVDENLENPPKPLPEVSVADAGKVLRVSATGTWEAQSLINAEEVAL